MNRSTLVHGALGLAGAMFGSLALAAQRARKAGAILLYHRISPEPDPCYPPLSVEQFRANCRFIADHYTVLPLAELLDRMTAGEPIEGQCAITFDDGYRDFLDHALPVLHDFNFPVTHFLVSDSLTTGSPPWTYRLNRLLAVGGASAVDGKRIALLPDRDAWLDERERAMPSLPPPPTMLRPGDLAGCGPLVSWGSHTRSHTFLDTISVERARSELTDSKRILEQVLGQPIRFLAYPNGYHSPDVMRLCAEAGYEAALAVGQRDLTARDSLFALPRIDLGWVSVGMLPLEVTGVIQAARRILRQ